ncbi:ATP-grasp domain-containing protein [Ureibacillus chungkukjangi]|uniref:ATP-grasp domain-containing protein n=1 Tax=Ureibacillus chungkukjangi TaxID=1202712 RepID=UPI00203BDB1B|nr:ATP-grasp domain-containing protein [Ureibacillus chungkukjangi]
MKTIVFIGLNKSGSSRDAVKAAVQLGYCTVVYTNNKKQIEQRKDYPEINQLIYLETLTIGEIKKANTLLQLKGFEILAITSFVDQYVYIASKLADEFCENVLSSEAIYVMENKSETRKFFEGKPYTPNFLIFEKNNSFPLERLIDKLKFPIMVKCAMSTGSKDVLYSSSLQELKKNFAQLKRKNPDETYIFEEYVEGDQYLVEVLVYNDEIKTAAIIKQEITRGERFIITGYNLIAEIDSTFEKGIKEVLTSIVESLKIKNGTFHIEMRLTQYGWKLIEINPRISGGSMNRMIQAAYGYNLVEETLKMLTGETPSLEKRTNKFSCTKHIIIDKKGVLKKVTGKKAALQIPGIVEVYIKPRKGTLLTPPLSMGHRYAYVIAIGDTMEEAERIAKDAANKIRFHLIEEEPLKND